MLRVASHGAASAFHRQGRGEYAPCRTSRVAGAQELFKYRRDEGGFTGWLANRLPDIPQRSAYQAIEIFQGIDPALFAVTANIPPFVLAEVSKAEPDIQALIAERVEAGEIFTAAKVKEILARAFDHVPPADAMTGCQGTVLPW